MIYKPHVYLGTPRAFVYLLINLSLILSLSCTKKTPDAPLAMVPERLTLIAENESILVGNSTGFTLTYFNTLGEEAPIPNGIIWSVKDATIATVDQQGIASGIGVGQTEIMVTYNTITAKALLNVVANTLNVAFVEIEPNTIELLLAGSSALTAMVTNIDGVVIPDKIITWEIDDAAIAEVNTSGQIIAKAYGTANVTATADGIKSAPAMVQVIRKGDFSGSNSKGSAKLKIENGVLILQTSEDFSVSNGPPDLRIYLGNNSNNIDGAIEVASLNVRSGLQTWNLSSSIDILDNRYVIVWCKQFGGTYGVADLGN